MILLSFLGSPLFYIAVTLFALMLIIFIHELGHFLVARWCGVDIDTFSIGFGKELYGWYDRHGTRWRLAVIPLGGYVKFKGDSNVASYPDAATEEAAKNQPGNYYGKPVWQRALVVAAGPLANFLLAICIYAVVFMSIGKPHREPRVGEIVPNSIAAQTGIQVGDLITNIDGVPITNFYDIVTAVLDNKGGAMTIALLRNDQPLTIVVEPAIVENKDGFGGTLKRRLLGIGPVDGSITFQRLSPVSAVGAAFSSTWKAIWGSLKGIADLVTGEQSPKQVGSLLTMGKLAGDAAAMGISSFASFVAFLSISIGLMNLFPIPVLDGGHLVYYAFEAALGRPLGKRAQEWGFKLGLSLIIMLMVFAVWNDMNRGVNMLNGG